MLLTSYPHHKDPDKRETGESELKRGRMIEAEVREI